MINLSNWSNTNRKLIVAIFFTSFWLNISNAGEDNPDQVFIKKILEANKEFEEIAKFSVEVCAYDPSFHNISNKLLFHVDIYLHKCKLPTENAEDIGKYGKQNLKKFFLSENENIRLIQNMYSGIETFHNSQNKPNSRYTRLFSFEDIEKQISDLYKSINEKYLAYDNTANDSNTSVDSEYVDCSSPSDIKNKQEHIMGSLQRLKKIFRTKCQYGNYRNLTSQSEVLKKAPPEKDELTDFLSKLTDEQLSQLPKLKPLTSYSIEELNSPCFYRDDEATLSCYEKTQNGLYTLFCSLWYPRKTQDSSVKKDKDD
jgi:hypothetical protein